MAAIIKARTPPTKTEATDNNKGNSVDVCIVIPKFTFSSYNADVACFGIRFAVSASIARRKSSAMSDGEQATPREVNSFGVLLFLRPTSFGADLDCNRLTMQERQNRRSVGSTRS
jgi:hypothetical protein